MQYHNIDDVIYTNTYTKQCELMDSKEVDKLEQAIEVHGYRGYSKMKNNGVVNIKPDDKELWKSLEKFKKIEENNIQNNIDKYGAISYIIKILKFLYKCKEISTFM